jgi:hypothetical protein
VNYLHLHLHHYFQSFLGYRCLLFQNFLDSLLHLVPEQLLEPVYLEKSNFLEN